MNTSTDKKDFFYIIVLALTLIAVLIGTTFAIYTLLHKQKEGSSAVYTGTLSIEYLSGNIINFNYLYPVIKPALTDTKNVYKNTFRVKNTGSLDSLLLMTLDITHNEFSNQTLMYTLFSSSGDELAQGYVEGNEKTTIANNIYLKNNEEEEFHLVIWLKENGKNQNQEMRKNLTGLIRIDASQKID